MIYQRKEGENETVIAIVDKVAEITLGLVGYPAFRINIGEGPEARNSALLRLSIAWNRDAHCRMLADLYAAKNTETLHVRWLWPGDRTNKLDLGPGLAVVEPVVAPTPALGRKDDADKARWDLLPWAATRDVVDVLTVGARKYAPNNWRFVDGWRWRYHAAALRHLAAWALGERLDPETGLPHLAHATCCLLFLADLDRPDAGKGAP